MAERNSGMPELGVYLVKPFFSASSAAALMCSGVSKSGSPAAKPQTSMPSAFIALALLSIESVRDGVRLLAREEMDMEFWILDFRFWNSNAGRRRARELFSEAGGDDFLKVVIFDLHDLHLALGVFRRVGGVRGVDHDGRAKLAPDRAGRRFTRIGRPEHFADFADGIDALIDERHA